MKIDERLGHLRRHIALLASEIARNNPSPEWLLWVGKLSATLEANPEAKAQAKAAKQLNWQAHNAEVAAQAKARREREAAERAPGVRKWVRRVTIGMEPLWVNKARGDWQVPRERWCVVEKVRGGWRDVERVVQWDAFTTSFGGDPAPDVAARMMTWLDAPDEARGDPLEYWRDEFVRECGAPQWVDFDRWVRAVGFSRRNGDPLEARQVALAMTQGALAKYGWYWKVPDIADGTFVPPKEGTDGTQEPTDGNPNEG